MGIGDWGLGIGDWGLGIGPNPQSPIPNPQSPIPIFKKIIKNRNTKIYLNFDKIWTFDIIILNKMKIQQICEDVGQKTPLFWK